jgi:hypothetical protein
MTMSAKHQRKMLRQQLNQHLDFIAQLEARAQVATRLGAYDSADGAQEDVQRRTNEVLRLNQALQELKNQSENQK